MSPVKNQECFSVVVVFDLKSCVSHSSLRHYLNYFLVDPLKYDMAYVSKREAGIFGVHLLSNETISMQTNGWILLITEQVNLLWSWRPLGILPYGV